MQKSQCDKWSERNQKRLRCPTIKQRKVFWKISCRNVERKEKFFMSLQLLLTPNDCLILKRHKFFNGKNEFEL